MLDEIKFYVMLHAKTLNVDKEVAVILHGVEKLDDGDYGWGSKFLLAAQQAEKENNILLALGLYNIARFPYPKTPMQLLAYNRYLILFKKYYCECHGFIEKSADNGLHKFFFKKGKYSNLIILCGGIIALKEQWANAAQFFNSMGFSVVVTEMPSVGENFMTYDSHSVNMFSSILNELNYREEGSSHLIAMSFSGYIALMNSFSDKRIGAISMVGAPVYDLYHNYNTFSSLPSVTKDILGHLVSLQKGSNEVFSYLNREFSHEIKNNPYIDIFYLQSRYDDIISLQEADYLKERFSNFNKLCLPDVHGSPNYYKTVVLYILWSVLKYSKKQMLLQYVLPVMIHSSRLFYNIKKLF